LAACHITQRYCAQKHNAPPPPTVFEIHGYKNQQEQIKRCPEIGNAQIGQYTVKKWIALMIIYLYKKPLIPLF
jgi:hypothetical protein